MEGFHRFPRSILRMRSAGSSSWRLPWLTTSFPFKFEVLAYALPLDVAMDLPFPSLSATAYDGPKRNVLNNFDEPDS